MSRATTFAIGAAAVVVLAATASSIFNSEDPAGFCDPAEIFAEDFDGVIPPTLPPEWVATNAIDPDGVFWVTSNFGDPSLPADSPPNAAFVNDPSAISDKRLDSPSIFLNPVALLVEITFRNNFNLQDGFDGACWKLALTAEKRFKTSLHLAPS